MKSILTWAGITTLFFAQSVSGQVRQIFRNPLSSFPVTIDGLIGGGVGGEAICPNPLVEWSDVAPAAFVGPLGASALPRRAPVADAEALVYTVVCPNPVGPDPRARVEFLFAGSAVTESDFQPGQTIAEIRFPIVTDGDPEPGHSHAHAVTTLRIFGAICPEPFGPVLIDADGDGVADGAATEFFEIEAEVEGTSIELDGLQVGVGFGLSPLDGTTPHLILEVSLPLLLEQDFVDASVAAGGPFSTAQDGVICPTPAIDPAPAIDPSPVIDPQPIVWSVILGSGADAPPVSSFALAVEADGGVEVDSSSVPTLLNLAAVDHAGLGKALTVVLPAGSYLAIPVAGTYRAYNAWSLVEQCDAEGRCRFGWSTIFGYHTPGGGTVVAVSGVWETPELALQRTHGVPIVLTEETTVSFFINDTVVVDNQGGVSVQISPADFSQFPSLEANVAMVGDNVELSWPGEDGAWYYLLRSTDLRNWTPPTGGASTYILPEGKGAPLTYSERANEERAFFRVFCFPPGP